MRLSTTRRYHERFPARVFRFGLLIQASSQSTSGRLDKSTISRTFGLEKFCQRPGNLASNSEQDKLAKYGLEDFQSQNGKSV